MATATLTELTDDGSLTGFRIAERWGVVAEVGYQAVPDVLIFRQKELALTSAELNVLLNLTAHWWRPQSALVFPGVATIARRMDVTPRTVHRIIGALVGKGMIKRKRTTSGEIFYDLAPLKAKLVPLAQKALDERRQLRLLQGA